jgi:hypothetical protein
MANSLKDVTIDLKYDIKKSKGVIFKERLKNGSSLGLEHFIIGDKNIYIGNSQQNQNLPFKIDFCIGTNSIFYKKVKGIPLPGHEWKETKDIYFKSNSFIRLPENTICDIICDMPESGDPKLSENIVNNDSVDLSRLNEIPCKGIYIDNAKVSYLVELLDSKTKQVVAKINVHKTKSNNDWRESEDIQFINEPSCDQLICKVPEGIKFTIKNKISYGKDAVCYQNVKNGTQVSYKQLTRTDVYKQMFLFKDKLYRGAYIGETNGQCNIEIVDEKTNSVLAQTKIGLDSPINSTFKSSRNFVFTKINLYYREIKLDEIIKIHSPIVQFSNREQYYPSQIEHILNKVDLYDKNNQIVKTLDNIAELCKENNDKYFGWIPNKQFNEPNSLDDSKVYTVIDENSAKKLKFTFNTFYPCNTQVNEGVKQIGKWERFSVIIDKNKKKNAKYRFYHHDETNDISYKDLESFNNKPLIYISANTHNGYWSTNQEAIQKDNEKVGGGKNFEVIDRIVMVTDSKGESKEKWIDWKGKWGESEFQMN